MYPTVRQVRQGAILLLALVLAVFGLAVPAGTGVASAAESADQQTLVTPVRIDSGIADFGHSFRLAEDGEKRSVALFAVELPEDRLARAYCINAVVASADGGHNLSSFGAEGIPGGPHVRWILKNAYPGIEADELAENAGVTGTLSEKDAITATQFALWHFTNPDVRRPTLIGVDDETRARIEEVADHLVERAVAETAPEANLALTPQSFDGHVGSDIGEFTVSFSADNGELTIEEAPEGVELVNLDSGSTVGTHTAVTSGQRFSVRVPEGLTAGSAKLKLTADVPLQSGSVLVYEGGKAQQLALVSDTHPVQQQAVSKVNWTEVPTVAPKIGTRARDREDSDQILAFDGGIVVDTVSYTGLIPGERYTLTGVLVDGETHKAIDVTARRVFTPEGADGSVDVEFTVPAGYAGRKLVAFERLFSGDDTTAEPVAVHEDPEDAGQTVTVEEEPVVEIPVTEIPVTEEPVVEEPVTEVPDTEDPTVEEPVVEVPVVQVPVTEKPVVEVPVTEEPVVETPVVDEPIVEVPVVQVPVTEDPVVEVPVTEEPVVETPVVDEPVAGGTEVEEPEEETVTPAPGDNCTDGRGLFSTDDDCGPALSVRGLALALLPAVVLAVIAGGASSAVAVTAPVTGSSHASVVDHPRRESGSVHPPAATSTPALASGTPSQPGQAQPQSQLDGQQPQADQPNQVNGQQLANTGADVLFIVLAGLVLLLLGAGLLERRRRA
ncbi:VaFE repeat-containing surface-anchored protein [Corynebacterium sp. CCM 9186]|uniref:VaFE repeat-containing surface-anchored protein n=1 Tax=Corynebacterium meridianum TaxID=2765363 RepID=UPI002003D00B|nr:VaFE repeat-containing surface-anchored protein [Corynebacterium meridianum]